MLVLTRRVGEAICIAETIRIVVLEVRGNQVRLGIAAPEDVIVDRLEVHEKRRNPPQEWADPAIYRPVP